METVLDIEDDNLKFNFLDNINCIVRTTTDAVDVDNSAINLNKIPVLMYKPLYYRTYELQHIYLSSTLEQNVGINLVNYFTKVKLFKMIINSTTLIERSRNDTYVIFNVEPSLILAISGLEGRYYILNENDEYVSFGKFSVS